MQLKDMKIAAQPSAKMLKALGVIADSMHTCFGLMPWIAHMDKSKESCILSSLAVRDFLFKIGFTDAEVAPCVVFVRRDKGDEVVHTLGIGHPEDRTDDPGRWRGHMVVKVPSQDILIDTTLYQAKRPQHWPDFPGMIASELVHSEGQMFGLDVMSYHVIGNDALGDDMTAIIWLDDPKNKRWKAGPDAIKHRRDDVVALLVKRFGVWNDAPVN